MIVCLSEQIEGIPHVCCDRSSARKIMKRGQWVLPALQDGRVSIKEIGAQLWKQQHARKDGLTGTGAMNANLCAP